MWTQGDNCYKQLLNIFNIKQCLSNLLVLKNLVKLELLAKLLKEIQDDTWTALHTKRFISYKFKNRQENMGKFNFSYKTLSYFLFLNPCKICYSLLRLATLRDTMQYRMCMCTLLCVFFCLFIFNLLYIFLVIRSQSTKEYLCSLNFSLIHEWVYVRVCTAGTTCFFTRRGSLSVLSSLQTRFIWWSIHALCVKFELVLLITSW